MRHISKAEALERVERLAANMDSRYGGCALCARLAETLSFRCVLNENEHAVAMLDQFAARPGHLVVVLRRHVEKIADLSWPEYAGIQRLAWEGARALEKARSPARIFMAALGSKRPIGVSFPHHHVHVIPLASGDARDRPAEVLTWQMGVWTFDEGEEQRVAEELRRVWALPLE
ncbi:MAG: HIT family protein [Polyangiaceae bacterium]|nr:HIT family protein [Polyangiaceae bacterium]